MVEPVVESMGCFPASDDYLVALRLITERENCVLIFDEVMTGFRVAYGGAQELYNIHPDLTTMGKIIGGGFPVGAYGGFSGDLKNVGAQGAGCHAGAPLPKLPLRAFGGGGVKKLRHYHNECFSG